MGLSDWWARATGSSAVAVVEAAPTAAPAQVTRLGYEHGIPDQGLNEWSATPTGGLDRRTMLGELYEAYLACPWAWAGVNAIARRVTAGGLVFGWDPGEGADGDEEQPDKPDAVVACERLFRFCNEREDLRQIIRGVITDLLVFGDAYLEVVWLGKVPVALYSLDCPSTSPIADNHGKITGYVQVTDYGQRATFEPHQVIHFSLDSPRSGVFGVSPMQAALNPIQRWLFAAATQLQTYRRGDPLNLHVDLPAEMSGPDIRRWIAQHMARNVGPSNIGYPVITKGGGKVNELGARRIEAGLSVLDKARDEVLAALGVPPAKAGVIESGNIGGGTDEGQDKTFEVQTCDPIASLILDKLQFHLAFRGFGVEGWTLQFSEVDLRDSKTIEEVRATRFKHGVLTLNEWRAETGKAGVEGGDQALVLVGAGGAVLRARDVEASALAGIAKQVQGTGWQIADRGEEDDAPIVLVKADPPAAPAAAPFPPRSPRPWALPPGADDEDPFDDQGSQEVAPPKAREAAAGGHTGGMVALLPDAATAAALEVDGGLPAGELHCTLAYLGDDVTSWPVESRHSLIEEMTDLASRCSPIDGRVLGRTVFNEDGGPDGDLDPCAVYLIGDAPGLDSLRAHVRGDVEHREGVPAQREPYVAHVTAGYGLDADDLTGAGEVQFDRLVVALAGEWTELPLGGDPAEETTVETAPAVEAAGGPVWPGWERDDQAGAHWATELQKAAAAAFDADDVAAGWMTFLGHRQAEEASPPPPGQSPPPPAAGAWLAAQGIALQGAVEAVLPEALTEGYLIGIKAAAALVADMDVDWSGWEPGDADAARLILGEDGKGEGLARLLAESEVRLTGIADNRMEWFAKLLAKAAGEGWSVDRLARALRDFGNDRTWAEVTAHTELARAISAATLDEYRESGIDQHEWSVSGPDPLDRVQVCPICLGNAAAGPIDVGSPFPSGELAPPGHHRCRCALVPYIDLDDDEAAEAVVDAVESWDGVELDEDGWDALTEADRNRLRNYWLKPGPKGGRRRWRTWTQLRRLLRKHVPDGFAKRLASTIFHLRYGYWPGDKRNRKRKGRETAPDGWQWSVEEARYVRTAAGARHYKQPIGSLITKKSGGKAKSAPGVAGVARAAGVRPSGPAGKQAASSDADRVRRKTLLVAAERRDRVRPYDADPGSYVASALQSAIARQKPVYVHSEGSRTVLSGRPSGVTGGAQFMVRPNGTVWRRSFTRGGEERLQQVSHERVVALAGPHLGLGGQPIPRPAINPRVAARDPKSLDDFDLDEAMQAALTLDDLGPFEKLAAEADRRDAKRQESQRRSEAAERAKAEEFERLITLGYSDEEAMARAYGVSVDQQRRTAALAALRRDGYQGRSLEDAARAAFRDAVMEQYFLAEDATRGTLVNRKSHNAGVRGLSLFTGSETRARKHASDELKEWWDANGRLTFEEFLADLLDDPQRAARIRRSRTDFHT